jgi:poly(A) polymerase
MEHPRFRAGYDFLCLRAASGETDAELAQWWTEFQAADPARREALLVKPQAGEGAKKKRRRGPRRNPDDSAVQPAPGSSE